jgi:hypothetical protein
MPHINVPNVNITQKWQSKMTPELRFHSIVISITTAIVFLVWLGLNAVIIRFPFTAVVLSGLISIGLYRTLTLLFLSLFRNFGFVKKFILGPRYMEGVWAGFFIGHKNKVRFFFEIFEQNLSRTIIRGRVFRADGSFHGSWIAEDATIDPTRGKLTYHYKTDAIGNTFINPGIGSFDIDRPAGHKAPEKLFGFSSDLFNPHKLVAFEEKILASTMIESAEAFKMAKRIYEKNKDHVKGKPVNGSSDLENSSNSNEYRRKEGENERYR